MSGGIMPEWVDATRLAAAARHGYTVGAASSDFINHVRDSVDAAREGTRLDKSGLLAAARAVIDARLGESPHIVDLHDSFLDALTGSAFLDREQLVGEKDVARAWNAVNDEYALVALEAVNPNNVDGGSITLGRAWNGDVTVVVRWNEGRVLYRAVVGTRAGTALRAKAVVTSPFTGFGVDEETEWLVYAGAEYGEGTVERFLVGDDALALLGDACSEMSWIMALMGERGASWQVVNEELNEGSFPTDFDEGDHERNGVKKSG